MVNSLYLPCGGHLRDMEETMTQNGAWMSSLITLQNQECTTKFVHYRWTPLGTAGQSPQSVAGRAGVLHCG